MSVRFTSISNKNNEFFVLPRCRKVFPPILGRCPCWSLRVARYAVDEKMGAQNMVIWWEYHGNTLGISWENLDFTSNYGEYTLWWTSIQLWKITMFNGYINYVNGHVPCRFLYVYQRVIYIMDQLGEFSKIWWSDMISVCLSASKQVKSNLRICLNAPCWDKPAGL